MKSLFRNLAVIILVFSAPSTPLWVATAVHAQGAPPSAVQVEASDGLQTRILAQPNPTADVIDVALEGDILEVRAQEGEYYEIRLPGTDGSGYVLVAETLPWAPPEQPLSPVIIAILVALGLAVVGGGAFVLFRLKRPKPPAPDVARAEELYRTGEYAEAAAEFNRYIEAQGGEIRNADVYRRLALCYQRLERFNDASRAWEKMQASGNITREDYHLGVELMLAMGREEEAAAIYEQLLGTESDPERVREIRKKLFVTFKRLKNPRKVMQYANQLISAEDTDSDILAETVSFLIDVKQTKLALESENKTVIKAICEEFLDEQSMSDEAEKIYLKCLSYDRTDKRLHKILAKKYQQAGDFRKAVSELTILSQIDKENAAEYTEQAAKLYIENEQVDDALSGGNPNIIKKIAQQYLTRSEVHPVAVSVYEKVLEFQPRAVGINKILSTVYLTRGDLQKYMEKLRLLHEIDGKSQDYLTDLARCMIDNNLVHQAVKEGNRDLTAKILRQLLRREAHDDQAVGLFEKLLHLEKDNERVRKAAIAAYQKRGEPEKELEHTLFLASRHPRDTELIQRATKLAVKHRLHELTLKKAPGPILLLVAREAAKAKLQGPAIEQLLKKALEKKSDEHQIREHLASLQERQAAAAPAASPAHTPMEPTPSVLEPTPSVMTTHPTSPDLSPTPHDQPGFEDDEDEDTAIEVDDGFEDLEEVDDDVTEEEPLLEDNSFAPTAEDDFGRTDPAAQAIGLVDASADQDRPRTAASTFVSSFESGGPRIKYEDYELFRPDAGGLAYKPVEQLWSDGWGAWHRAMEVNTGKLVLLRTLRKNLLDQHLTSRFIEEVVDLGLNMVHDGILEQEELVKGPNGATGLVHPHLPRTLDMAWEKGGPKMELDTAMSIIRKITDALAYAQNFKGRDAKVRRAYHLQLQPNQVLVSADLDTVKVCNMGFEQTFRNITRGKQPWWEDPGMNPAYMPPELFPKRPGNINEKAVDVYLIGLIAYLLVTGEPPFEGPGLDDFKFQHTKIYPAPPRLVHPDVPDWLEPLILGCLDKDPNKRWASVIDIQETFSREIGPST